MLINNLICCWQTSNGKNSNFHQRIVESGIMGADSPGANGSFFLSLDTAPTGAENLRGGLHAVTGSTGNDTVVAASARAVRQFSYSSGVIKVKQNLDEAI